MSHRFGFTSRWSVGPEDKSPFARRFLIHGFTQISLRPVRSGKSPTDFRDDVAGDAIALPEFWSASGACAFVLKSSFNSLYDPFGSPCRGQKPSLPLKKAPPLTTPSLLRSKGENRPTRCSNRYAIRLADHQRSRQVMRDGTARGGKAICKYLNFLIWIEVLKETGSSLL